MAYKEKNTLKDMAPCPEKVRLSWSRMISISITTYSASCFVPLSALNGVLQYEFEFTSATTKRKKKVNVKHTGAIKIVGKKG